ncbi:bis(5'-nucleosyl)-tetraphosphatase (symmetrical) YqeK [Elusimicrobiota bacterium]
MSDLKKEKILSYIKKHLKPERYKHTLGMLRIATSLARKYKVSQEKVVLASLLHDIGKGLSNREMIKYVKKYKLGIGNIKNIIQFAPPLLHSYVSAHIAKTKFNIKDKQILKAIALHTFGDKNMDNLSKIIYLADAIAPDRRFPHVKMVRRKAERSLNAALMDAMKYKLFHVLSNGKWLHPQAVKAWNWLLKNMGG